MIAKFLIPCRRPSSGLVTAVDKYDPGSSGPFGSYASLWILQNIGRAQATQRPAVYYPVHKKEGYLQCTRF